MWIKWKHRGTEHSSGIITMYSSTSSLLSVFERGIGQLGHFLSSVDQHRPRLYKNCSRHFDSFTREQLYVDAKHYYYIVEPL